MLNLMQRGALIVPNNSFQNFIFHDHFSVPTFSFDFGMKSNLEIFGLSLGQKF